MGRTIHIINRLKTVEDRYDIYDDDEILISALSSSVSGWFSDYSEKGKKEMSVNRGMKIEEDFMASLREEESSSSGATVCTRVH